MAEIKELPQEEQYFKAYRATDRLFESRQGIRNVAENRLLDVEFDPRLQTYDNMLRPFGEYFADEAAGDEARIESANAYVEGFMLTEYVTTYLQLGGESTSEKIRHLSHWNAMLDTRYAESEEEARELERANIEQFGGFGLSQLDRRSTLILETWATKLHGEQTRNARIFALGSGAMIAAGISRQSFINDRIIEGHVEGIDTIIDQEWK